MIPLARLPSVPLDVPALRSDMLAEPPETVRVYDPLVEHEDDGKTVWIVPWHRPKPKTIPRSRWIPCFFIPEENVETAWSRIDALTRDMIADRPYAMCMLNLSIWMDDPWICRLYNFWRIMFVAAEWQTCGLKIVPHINIVKPSMMEVFRTGFPEFIPFCAVNFQVSNRQPETFPVIISGTKLFLSSHRVDTLLVYGAPERSRASYVARIEFAGLCKRIIVLSRRDILRKSLWENPNKEEYNAHERAA